jgi:hypothetical protein
MIDSKKYKSGEVPKVGDLILRISSIEQYDFRLECYGIVTGFFIIGAGGTCPKKFPKVLWAGASRPRKSLIPNVRLVSRK